MTASTEKIATDVKVLKADVEELVKASAAVSGERLVAARDRAQAALANVSETVALRGRDAVEMADQYVKIHPWTAVGVSAGIGLLLGIVIGRR